MYRCHKLSIFILITILFSEICLADIGKDEFMGYLEARDTSISSYSLDMQQTNLKITFDEYDLLKDFIKKANRMEMDNLEPSDVIDELLQYVGTNDAYRVRRIVLERGEHFKSIQTNNKTESMKVIHYDGELYREYTAIIGKTSARLDIHPSIMQVGRGSLSDFGIGYFGSGKMWSRPTITAFEQHSDGILSVKQAIEDGVTYTAEYDKNLNLNYGYYLEEGKKVQESWYLSYDEFGDYFIPRVHLQTWPEKDGHYVICYVLGDVKINCPISDANLAMPKMPPWTIVMDYRHEPPRQTQLIDYPHEILRDELMLGDLENTLAQLPQNIETDSLPEVNNQMSETENTEQSPTISENEQPAKEEFEEDINGKVIATNSNYKLIAIIAAILFILALASTIILKRKSN